MIHSAIFSIKNKIITWHTHNLQITNYNSEACTSCLNNLDRELIQYFAIIIDPQGTFNYFVNILQEIDFTASANSLHQIFILRSNYATNSLQIASNLLQLLDSITSNFCLK